MAVKCVDFSRRCHGVFPLFNVQLCVINTCVLSLFFYSSQSVAKNWRVIPSIQLQEIYSDNINLNGAAEAKSAFVTQVNPAATIIWQAGKSRLNLRYNLQNIYNAHGDGAHSLAHQLQLNVHNELLKNRFFVDVRASMSQQNISTKRLVTDNISGDKNDVTTVNTLGITPTWLVNLGHFANGNVQVSADSFSSGAATLSDSETVAERLQMSSGSQFKRLRWSVGFNNSQSYRSGGETVNFQNSTTSVRTQLSKRFSVFATLGHSANYFNSTTNTSTNNNGFFYTVGGRWSPSTYYWLEAGGGNNNYVTVNISPMKRLNWMTTVRHNNIGLNSGTTWQTALNYHNRHSTWTLTHDNDTTTVQEILSKQTAVTNPQDVTDFQSLMAISTINAPLVDGIVERESWNLSAMFFTGKSSISIHAFNQDRTFQGSQYNVSNTEHIRGANAMWRWQFARKTSAYFNPAWQQIDRYDTNNSRSHDNRYDFIIGLSQAITQRINGQLEFRHLTQTSDLSANNYQEDRAMANLFMRF